MKRDPIKMPVLSDTMKTGHLTSWQKQVGDPVKKGDILAEIESDKAAMDLEAFDDGYLAGPLAKPDSDIAVGTVIGYLVDSKEAATAEPAEKAAAAQVTSEPPAEPPQVTPSEPVQASAPPPEEAAPSPPPAPRTPINLEPGAGNASPYARGLAHELGIDLSTLRPGDNGVINSRQVLAAAMSGPQPDLNAGPAFSIQPLSSMQRAVAENMTATIHTPTFRVSTTVPVDPLQQTAKAQKTSFTLLLARAAALTITQHPGFNNVYTPAGLATREQVDVGIAMDVPGGLVTPVIRDAARRSIDELKEDWRILRDKARRQRLVPEDYEGATFYISNMGIFPEVQSFDAIVPLGAAAILSVGASQDGKATMTLSCDHRVVYGADAARFMETFSALVAKADF